MRPSQLPGLLWCCNSKELANSVLGAGEEPRPAASAVEDDAAFIPAFGQGGAAQGPGLGEIRVSEARRRPRLAQRLGLGETRVFETRNRPCLAQRPCLGENCLPEQRSAPALAQVNGSGDSDVLPRRDLVPADFSQAGTLCQKGRYLPLGRGVFSQAETLRGQVSLDVGRCVRMSGLRFSNA